MYSRRRSYRSPLASRFASVPSISLPTCSPCAEQTPRTRQVLTQAQGQRSTHSRDDFAACTAAARCTCPRALGLASRSAPLWRRAPEPAPCLPATESGMTCEGWREALSVHCPPRAWGAESARERHIHCVLLASLQLLSRSLRALVPLSRALARCPRDSTITVGLVVECARARPHKKGGVAVARRPCERVR